MASGRQTPVAWGGPRAPSRGGSEPTTPTQDLGCRWEAEREKNLEKRRAHTPGTWLQAGVRGRWPGRSLGLGGRTDAVAPVQLGTVASLGVGPKHYQDQRGRSPLGELGRWCTLIPSGHCTPLRALSL